MTARDPRVAAAQVDLLYRQALPGFVATMVNAVVVVVGLWGVVGSTDLFVWLAAMALVTLARAALVAAYLRAEASRPAENTAHWRRYFVLGVAAMGVAWGILGGPMLPSSLAHQVFVGFALAGMTAGATAFLASVPYAYLAYLAPALAPFIARLYGAGELLQVSMGIFVTMFTVAMLATSRRMYTTMTETLKLRFANDDLVDVLRQEKERAERANRRLTLHIAQTPLAVIEWDVDLAIVDWNAAATRLLGYEREEAIGRAAPILFDESGWEALASAAPDGIAARRFENVTKYGARIPCEWSTTPLIDASGARVGFASVVHDLRDREELDRAKSEFIASVSHELRTPLTSIRGSLGLLAGGLGGDLPREARELVAIAYGNSGRLDRLVRDLLDFNRVESGSFSLEFAPFDLVDSVRRTVEANAAYATQLGVSLVVRDAPPRLLVNSDEDRLSQVVTNLISNAAKFAPAGTEVVVRISADDETARIAVADRGPGVPDDFRGRIFGRFAQADPSIRTRRGGAGLGLSISRAIVTALGGEIGFLSDPESGATFFVSLPITPAPEARRS